MSTQTVKQFDIIGIAIRTTNENQQSAKDIPLLWQRFMSEQLSEKIPNKTDDTIYCVYTDYEKDHTKPYTTILGCRVNDISKIPAGMVSSKIQAGSYELFTAKGNLMQGAIINEWMKIWEAPVQRVFTTDFEVYGEKAKNLENAEVPIFIAVK